MSAKTTTIFLFSIAAAHFFQKLFSKISFQGLQNPLHLQNLVQSTSFFCTCIVWFILICTHISRYNFLALVAASCLV